MTGSVALLRQGRHWNSAIVRLTLDAISRAELPTGTVTFLFTDVEGSTRLLHEFGEQYVGVLSEHRRVLREAFRVATGSIFRWKTGPGTVTSTLRRVEPPRMIAWTGKTLGIKAIHFWYLEARDGKTFVRTEESYEGLVARLFRGPIQKMLDRALADGLRSLKAEVEQPATRQPKTEPQ